MPPTPVPTPVPGPAPTPAGRDPRAAVAAAAYVALAVVDTRLAADPDPRVRQRRVLTKPLLMPALSAAFGLATAGRSTRLRRGTLVAQALSGAGDVALLGSSERAFLSGLGAFFGAHIAYVTAFAGEARPWSDRTHLTGVRAAGAAFVTLAPTLGWAAGRRDPTLRGPVAAYAGILTSMVAASSRLGDHVPLSARRAVVLGTVTFLVSDATIALRTFVLPNPTTRSDAIVMATYTAGQALIAVGVTRALVQPGAGRGDAPLRGRTAPPTRVEGAGG